MEQNRKFQRFPVELNATRIGAGSNELRKCKIKEVSRSGVIIAVHLKEKIKIGRSLMLEIDLPGRKKPMIALVKLKWIKGLDAPGAFNFIAGGKLTIIRPEDKNSLLDYAYTCLLNKERG
ncbi:MAG: PilZ domain-containing protein [Pseudomonadota bacterium]